MLQPQSLIFHIADRADWQNQQQTHSYRHPSLDAEGFIHCSTAQQVAWVANSFFPGQSGLVLLWIDRDRLQSPLQFDAVEGIGRFPHIYGEINRDAVVQVTEFEPDLDGKFIFTY